MAFRQGRIMQPTLLISSACITSREMSLCWVEVVTFLSWCIDENLCCCSWLLDISVDQIKVKIVFYGSLSTFPTVSATMAGCFFHCDLVVALSGSVAQWFSRIRSPVCSKSQSHSGFSLFHLTPQKATTLLQSVIFNQPNMHSQWSATYSCLQCSVKLK